MRDYAGPGAPEASSIDRRFSAMDPSQVLDAQAAQVVKRLHAQSERQSSSGFFAHLVETFLSRLRSGGSEFSETSAGKRFLSDKLVALEPEKAALCYLLCRSLNAHRVVEAGTSHGVSTIYLACAVRDNTRATGGQGTVIGTEHEPAKAAAARRNFAEAGVGEFIDLREGDLRETLKDVAGPVDFMLVDIWIPMALPALRLVAPRLRPGAIVLCDNTARYVDRYAEYLAYVRDSANGFRSMTLPMKGGFEMSVRVG
jgi:predicted O-methyltransferase YrrM